VIAKRAQVPVQTLIIDTDSPLLCKGWRFDPSPDAQRFVAEPERYYRNERQSGPTWH
jgi:hypothetical protein